MSVPIAVATPVANHEPTQQIVRVEVASLKIDNIREDMGTPEENEQLANDIQTNGQAVPLILQPDGVTIGDGHRRVEAAKRKGIKHLNAIILTKPLSRLEITQLQLRTAVHRKGLNDYEQYKAVKQIQAAHPEWTRKQIAQDVSMDPSKITELLTEGIPAVEQAFKDGKIKLGIRYELAKASTDQQEQMLAARLSGASREQIVTARRRKTSDQPEEKVSRARLPLPGGAVVTVAAEGDGMTVTGIIELLTSVLKECREAEKAGISAKSLQATLKDKAQAKTE